MAVVFTLKASSELFLKYSVTGGIGESGDLTGATMATDSKAGPLRTYLATACADQAAARALLFDNAKLNVTFPATNRDVNAAWIVDANVDGTVAKLTCSSAQADVTGTYLTIEFRHSEIR